MVKADWLFLWGERSEAAGTPLHRLMWGLKPEELFVLPVFFLFT